MGRPSKYKPEFCEQAAKLCLLGATDADLAGFFDVHIDTIAEWKTRHPAFSDALKDSKDTLDAKVEQSLFRRAMGYSHPAIKMFQAGQEIIRAEYTERYPPDTTACIFWLKNRQPERWRDKSEIDVTKRTVNDYSDDDLAAIATGRAINKARGAKSKSDA